MKKYRMKKTIVSALALVLLITNITPQEVVNADNSEGISASKNNNVSSNIEVDVDSVVKVDDDALNYGYIPMESDMDVPEADYDLSDEDIIEADLPDSYLPENVEIRDSDKEETTNQNSVDSNNLTRLLGSSSAKFDLLESFDLLKSALTGTSLEEATYKSTSASSKDKLNWLRSQGTYSTCWAFSAIGLMEADLVVDDGKAANIVDLSELHLAYYSYHSERDPLNGFEGDSNSWNSSTGWLDLGGSLAYASNILLSWSGAALESAVPYSDAATVAESSEKFYDSAWMNYFNGDGKSAYSDDVAHLQNVMILNYQTDKAAIKSRILKHGSVGISYYEDAGTTAGNAGIGSHNSDYNSYYKSNYNAAYRQNHAVNIVGWDDNFSADKFGTSDSSTKPSSDGAWLIRNSWYNQNDSSDDAKVNSFRGYFWMSYEEKSIADAVYVYDCVYKDSEGYYDNNYQYDGSCTDGTLTLNANEARFANVFTVPAKSTGEELKAVGIKVANTNVKYEISVYKGLNKSNSSSSYYPESGTRALDKQEGEITFEGFYTVPLDKTISLRAGETFSVVVKLKSSDSSQNITIPVECSNDSLVSSAVKRAANTSYIATNNSGSWTANYQTQFTYGYQTTYVGNIRLKAYTNNVPGISDGEEDSSEETENDNKEDDNEVDNNEVDNGGTNNNTTPDNNEQNENATYIYNINYFLYGGINTTSNPTSYDSRLGVASFASPTRAGYEFKGWYSDSNFIRQISSIAVGTTGDRFLYAKWEAVESDDNNSDNNNNTDTSNSNTNDTRGTNTNGTNTNDTTNDTSSSASSSKIKTKTDEDEGEDSDDEEELEIGELLEDDNGTGYTVLSDNEVSISQIDKKATKLTIPTSIEVDGVELKVTTIDAKAFSGCKKLKSLTITKNISTIGANAFKGCSNLKTITIKSTKLTKKSLSAKAFSGLSKDVVIKVPAKKLKSYKKIFYSKGLAKKAVIKKA